MKSGNNKKTWVVLIVLLAVVSFIAGVGRDSKAVNDNSSIVDIASEKILSGNFDEAAEMIRSDRPGENKSIDDLSGLIKEYQALSDVRSEKKEKTYNEYLAKLNEIIEKGVPEEVNEINEAFLSLIQAKEYADEAQQEKLLEMPFVLQLKENALKKGVEFEAKGEWVDAYAHCFYWLSSLYPDNDEYKDQGERLTRLAIIEMALKDNSCDSSRQRHEGVKPAMLVRAVRALDFNYVSLMDYAEMTKKGLEQCKLLGQVLYEDKKNISYRVPKANIVKWQDGIRGLQGEIKNSLGVLKKEDFIKVFSEVLELNEKSLRIPAEVVIVQFTEASLEALDPFTNLIWPWKVRDFQKNMTQDFTGIGIHITKIRGVLAVASLLPDTPAYRSGLDANDEILAVDGEETEDMTLTCVVSKITGPKGTKVTLTVRHEGAEEDDTEDIVIVRDRIVVPTIRGWIRDSEKGDTTGKADNSKWGHMIDPVNKIGYIRLTGFTDNTAPAMQKQLVSLENRGMNGLIVDIRDNSGGYLQTAAAIVDMFVEEGLIVKSQPRWGVPEYLQAHKKGTHPDYPLVILINGSSASASEIVAGALQDEKYKRATLVGTRSYGKGSVQKIVLYTGEGSQIKYTMAYYHLPSDQRVKNRYVMEKQGRKDWGIAPDVEVDMTSEEIKNMREIQWSNDILVSADHDKNGKAVKRYSAEEMIAADPQMQVALLVVKAKMIREGQDVQFPEKSDKEVAAQ